MLKFVEPGPYLRERTTLRLGGQTQAEVVVGAEEDLAELPGLLTQLGAAPLILGRGSNILALDEDLPLALVSVDFGATPAVIEDRGSEKMVRVADNGQSAHTQFKVLNRFSGSLSKTSDYGANSALTACKNASRSGLMLPVAAAALTAQPGSCW